MKNKKTKKEPEYHGRGYDKRTISTKIKQFCAEVRQFFFGGDVIYEPFKLKKLKSLSIRRGLDPNTKYYRCLSNTSNLLERIKMRFKKN